MRIEDVMMVAHQVQGRVRFRVRAHTGNASLGAVERAILAAPGVLHVRVNETAASIIVEYDPSVRSVESLLALTVDARWPVDVGARIDESIVVAASLDEVWAVLDDPGKAAANIPSELHVDREDSETWRVTLEVFGRRLQGRVRLTERLPNERLVLDLDGSVQGRYVLQLRVEPEGTRVHGLIWYDLGSALLDLAVGPMADSAIRRMLCEHLALIDRLVTQSARQDEAS